MGKNPIHFGVIRSKIKVTITINIIFQGNHVAKFAKDSIYRTKVIVRKRPLSKILFIVTVTLTFDPKINRVLPLYIGSLPNLAT
jgi:hypothetical protein